MSKKEELDKFKTRIVTGEGRLFYVTLLRPKPNDQGKDKYSVQYLFKKSATGICTPIFAAVEEAKRKFELKHNGGVRISDEDWKELNLPVRDGDKELATGKQKDRDYAGHWFFNASSDQKPGVVDKDVQEITQSGQIYSGMFAKIDVNFYPYVNKQRGVAAGLNHVQKTRDGTPKSGAGSASDSFSRYEDNDQDDDVAF